MTRDGGLIPGYEAEIHMALWQRILTAHVPRLWFIVSLIGCIFFAFILLMKYHSWVAVAPLLGWGVIYLVLVALTRWDRDFDSVLLMSFRYRSRYDAG